MTIREIHHTTKVLTHTRGKQLFYMFLIVLGFLLALYLYFLSTTVFSIVVRKNIEADIRSKLASIGEFELTYLALTASYDRSFIEEAGFVEPKDTSFVSRSSFISQAL